MLVTNAYSGNQCSSLCEVFLFVIFLPQISSLCSLVKTLSYNQRNTLIKDLSHCREPDQGVSVVLLSVETTVSITEKQRDGRLDRQLNNRKIRTEQ